MTTLFVKNLDSTKERKVRIFQITRDGGIYSDSDTVAPMDPLYASVGISLSPYVECEGTVNRGGILIPRQETDLKSIVKELEMYGIRVDILEEWNSNKISCTGGLPIAEWLRGSNYGTFELIVDNESLGQGFSLGYNDGDYDREKLKRSLAAKGITIIFQRELT